MSFKNENSIQRKYSGVVSTMDISPPESAVNNQTVKASNEGSVQRDTSTSSSNPERWENCDFETAITAAGFGKFSWLVRFLFFCQCALNVFRGASTSYIFPALECEFELTSGELGMTNAISFVGSILVTFAWGVVTDTLGRQKLMAASAGISAAFSLMLAFCTNYQMLLIAKLFAGIFAAGLDPMFTTYLAEVHSSEHRSSMMLWTGVLRCLTEILLPMVAWGVIPRDWSFYIGSFFIPSWRIFLLVCVIPSILCTFFFSLIPESPKFLMTVGKNMEALDVFRTIYFINTLKPKTSFPVKSLVKQIQAPTKTDIQSEPVNNKTWNAVTRGFQQFKPLFHGQMLYYGVVVIIYQFTTFLFFSTLRLWSPKYLTTAMEREGSLTNATSLCDLLLGDHHPVIASNSSRDCSGTPVNSNVFAYTTIIGITASLSCLAFSYILKFIEAKWTVIACTHLGGIIFGCLYFSSSSSLLVTNLTIINSSNQVAYATLISMLVTIFPTSVRATAMNLITLFIRIGAMLGNMIFPLLMEWQCSFTLFGGALLLNLSALLVWVLPTTKGRTLE